MVDDRYSFVVFFFIFCLSAFFVYLLVFLRLPLLRFKLLVLANRFD